MKEYHELFEHSGYEETPLRIEVRIRDFAGHYPGKEVPTNELCKLIDPSTGQLLKTMLFDENPCELIKYELLPKSNRLIIHARMIRGNDSEEVK